MKPSSPEQISKDSVDRKIANIPDFVIESVNELLAEKYKNGRAEFNNNEIIAKIQSKTGLPREEIFDKKWLDFEDCFRKEGWIVTYNRGAYYEDWTPYFTFQAVK